MEENSIFENKKVAPIPAFPNESKKVKKIIAFLIIGLIVISFLTLII